MNKCFLKQKGIANITWLITGILLISNVSCRPTPPDYVSDYDAVYTSYQKDFNFNNVSTYFLPDTVVYANQSASTSANHRFDAQILSTVKTNLNALGWKQLSTSSSAKADVVVLAIANSSTYGSCTSYCWYCDWGWYGGWGYYSPVWNSGWGWGYPTDISCGSYSSGTVVIGITAPGMAANKTLPVTWMGIANGLLQGSDSDISARLNKNINQMFLQSPYLK